MAISRRVRMMMLGLAAVLGGQHGALAADLNATPATADERPAVHPFNQWVVTLMPYAWLPFLAGEQTIRGRTVEIDVNPIELLQHPRAPYR